jgi:membrane protein
MFSTAWKMLKDTVLAFISDEALSRGAAIAFYTVTSIAPVLPLVGMPLRMLLRSS